MLGGWRSAWQIEAQRLHAAGLSLWSWRNQMLVLSAVPVAITLGLGFTLGAAAAALFVGQSVVAFTMLEIINYIEHYGLSRNEVKAEAAPGRSQGNFERVQPHHSWNSSHMLTNGFLINLQRHSDHHAHSGRPYPILRHHESAPQLPTGYAGMMVLALVPPLWFAVMNPRVAAWRAKYAAP